MLSFSILFFAFRQIVCRVRGLSNVPTHFYPEKQPLLCHGDLMRHHRQGRAQTCCCFRCLRNSSAIHVWHFYVYYRAAAKSAIRRWRHFGKADKKGYSSWQSGGRRRRQYTSSTVLPHSWKRSSIFACGLRKSNYKDVLNFSCVWFFCIPSSVLYYCSTYFMGRGRCRKMFQSIQS